MQFYMLLQEHGAAQQLCIDTVDEQVLLGSRYDRNPQNTPAPLGGIVRFCSEAHLGPVLSEGEGDANLGAWAGAGLALGPLFTATIRLCAILKGSSSEVPGLACLKGVLPANSASFLPTLACKRLQNLRDWRPEEHLAVVAKGPFADVYKREADKHTWDKLSCGLASTSAAPAVSCCKV